MASSHCMCTILPGPSGIDSRPPADRANRANLEVSSAPSALVCSPRTNGWDSQVLKWKRPRGMWQSQEKRGFDFQFRVSIGGQQGESGTLSGENSSPSENSPSVELMNVPRKAADIVQEYYDRINQRDYIGVANLFTEDCEYEDFNFPETTRGREEICKFFQKVMESFSSEMKFVIDDMTRDDPDAVGVVWHLDWRGKAFPFSRGCSFYRCVVNSSGERQIRFGRDIVEPATKPGAVSMGLLRLVTSLLERFPQLVDRL